MFLVLYNYSSIGDRYRQKKFTENLEISFAFDNSHIKFHFRNFDNVTILI